MSLLADTAADLGGCGTEDVPSLTRQHTGEPRLRTVPKFPDSSLPFAAHLAVASCSHHHHELLSRSAERAKTVSRAPRHSHYTPGCCHHSSSSLWTHSNPQEDHQKIIPLSRGILGSFPVAGWHPAAHNTWLEGDAKPSKTPPFISVCCNHSRKQPLT